ncbi:MAG TPA: hypothetical protein VNN18_12255 [Candidatus Xenobia bacterium]|nr:hypothetical protein [Candidatus Xenobia bacterium]
MTYLEVAYRYAAPLSLEQMKKLGELPGHYGIGRIRLDEANQVARIEFDASRLKETEVVHWIRRAGIPLTERADSPVAAG